MKNTEKAKYYYTSKMHTVREFFFSLLNEVLSYIYAASCLSIPGHAKIKSCVNELRIRSKMSTHSVSSLWKDTRIYKKLWFLNKIGMEQYIHYLPNYQIICEWF